MPTLISINTATVPSPVFVKLDTMPGDMIDLGINVSLPSTEDLDPNVVFSNVNSQDLLGAVPAVPYLWDNKNESIRLPLGLNDTSASLINTIQSTQLS